MVPWMVKHTKRLMRKMTCEGCGETYEEVDEDLMEDFVKQKDRIVEMFDRFKKFI